MLLSDTTDSTATNTGALQVLGGVGIAKSMVIGNKVGIGAPVPSSGGASSQCLLYISGNNITNQLWFNAANQGADNKNWCMGPNGNNFYFYVYNDAGTTSTNYMRIIRSANTITSVNFPNGNVGIGTENPGYLLDVNGSIRLGTANGSAFNSIRVVTLTLSTTTTTYGSNCKTNVSWGVTYPNANKIIPIISWNKPLFTGGVQTNDMFSVGLENITTTGAVVNLWRLDSPGTTSGVTVNGYIVIYELV